MRTYLSWLVGLGSDTANLVHYFKGRLNHAHVVMPEGRNAYINNYLDHMTQCPAQPADVSAAHARLRQHLHSLTTVDTHSPRLRDQSDSPIIPILENPDRYTLHLDAYEGILRQTQIENQQAARVVDLAQTHSHPQRFVEDLETQFPDFHASLTQFQHWLDQDSVTYSPFSGIIDHIANAITYADKDFDLAQLRHTMHTSTKSLYFPARREFSGVHIFRPGGDLSISHPHLQSLIPLLAIKTAQSRSDAQESRFPEHESTAARCQRLNQELAQDYEAKAKNDVARLEEIARDRDLTTQFLQANNITLAEIARLADIASYGDQEHDYGSKVDHFLYGNLFIAHVLHKQELIDLGSPAFQSFLKALLPRQSDSVWAKLQAAYSQIP